MQLNLGLSLEEYRNKAYGDVDEKAGHARLKYITESPGQDATYTAKLADAKDYIAAGYPADSIPYVWIHAEATATGSTPRQVADLIVSTAGIWSQVGSQIEGARQAAKLGIRNASSVAEIRTVVANFTAQMQAL